MKIIILVSGCIRSFNTNYSKLVELFLKAGYTPVFYIVATKDNSTDTYLWKPEVVITRTRNYIKSIKFVDDIKTDLIENTNHHLYSQWFKVKEAFDLIDDKDKDYIIVKMRTDVLFENCDWLNNIIINDDTLNMSNKYATNINASNKYATNINASNKYATNINASNKYILYIPTNDVLFVTRETQLDNTNFINDQIAVGSWSAMKMYCDFYTYLVNTGPHINGVSEILLYEYLQIINNTLNIMRFELVYKLVLSQCFIIAISGDSGSGKTTLSKIIKKIMPYDNTVVLETDRYHKWERGNINYETYTHLNPEANFLEKMTGDVYNLKLGKTIHQVDYDHSSGKFTAAELIEPKNNMVICGLHTLYDPVLLNLIDIRIYIDTEYELQNDWKIKRDIGRGHTIEKILLSIDKRKEDRDKYIIPQRDNANIIINHYTKIDNTTEQSTCDVRFILKNDVKQLVLESGLTLLTEDDFIDVDINYIDQFLANFWNRFEQLSLSNVNNNVNDNMNDNMNDIDFSSMINKKILAILISILYRAN